MHTGYNRYITIAVFIDTDLKQICFGKLLQKTLSSQLSVLKLDCFIHNVQAKA